MSTPTLWKLYCPEDEYPGLWRLWFTNQCVAVNFPPSYWTARGGKAHWRRMKKLMEQIRPGHMVVAALPERRVGRLGVVVSVEINQWYPLVLESDEWDEGEFGQRVLVRWDLLNSPDNVDLVVKLPEDFTLNPYESRHVVACVTSRTTKEFQEVMADPANWVGLLGRFGYERALSDYIALHPDRLEDGLQAQPNKKLREKVLRVRENMFGDRSRLDVLLRDREDNPVIVECKQESPSIGDVNQLRRYVRRLKKDIGEQARGILVHGGARRIDRKVLREARKHHVDVVQYKLDVEFAPSC
jgi:hypothetical protein